MSRVDRLVSSSGALLRRSDPVLLYIFWIASPTAREDEVIILM
jgi:hypothetical protein